MDFLADCAATARRRAQATDAKYVSIERRNARHISGEYGFLLVQEHGYSDYSIPDPDSLLPTVFPNRGKKK